MGIMARIFGDQMISLSGEEARTAITALRRSALAVDEPSDTPRSREIRERRESKLADQIGAMLDGGIR